ncbi:pseudouridine synthase [Haploplasma axanthum]|uniref:Pseudouridine synthase n=1 Tax=Haploplasma axanthum TaxID=29552 RepID=A0A449BCY1_HAPAX|nr:pseudouridine synthase [Haploplasma axanthum]VEU80285.1 ribosomal large subunit pseudouridine synthase B [Haploplasma axanthum]
MQKAIKKPTKKHNDNLIEHKENDLIRLNKFISDSGYCSRREADKLIEENKVTINGKIALLGTKVGKNDVVKVGNDLISEKAKNIYIMLHKPTGITCTNDLRVEGNIRKYVDYPELIFPIGRLDKDSSGLILLTNDGDIVNKILRAEHGHEKEYVVTVDKDYDYHFTKALSNGVKIYNQVSDKLQVTNKCEVKALDNRTFKIILKQGLNRQIRRMTETLGYNVKSLKRIRVMNVRLGDLRVGEWRYLNDNELKEINKMINQN